VHQAYVAHGDHDVTSLSDFVVGRMPLRDLDRHVWALAAIDRIYESAEVRVVR
jgi:hypothetical protein